MNMARVDMIRTAYFLRMFRMIHMTMVMMIMAQDMEMLRHSPILRAPCRGRSLLTRLLRSLTRPPLEWIDAPSQRLRP